MEIFRKAMLAIAGLAAMSAAPASASWQQGTDYVPASGPVSAGATGAQLQSGGFYDVAGSIWSIDSSNRVVPSGQPASISGNNFGANTPLARTSDTAITNQQIAVKFSAVLSGSVVSPIVHYQTSGSTFTGYLCTVNPANSIIIYRVIAGASTVLTNANITALTAGQNYTIACGVVGNGSNSSTVTAVLTNSAGAQVTAPLSFTDTTTNAAQGAGVTGVYEYLNAAGSANYLPITELLTYTYVAPVTLPLSGLSAGAYNPIIWDKLLAASSDYGVTADTIQATSNGAGIRFNVGATTFVGLSLDPSIWSAFAANTSTFQVQWSIDNGPLQFGTYARVSGDPTTYTVPLGQNLANTSHTVEFSIVAINTNNTRRYSVTAGTAPNSMLRINGIVADQGASLAPFSGYTLPATTCVVYGDSISEGAFTNPVFYNGVSFTQLAYSNKAADWGAFSYGQVLASGLGCDPAVVGYSGTGYDWAPNFSGAVAMKTSFGSYSAGRPRQLPSFAPVGSVFNVLGTNDALQGVAMSTIQSDLVSTILPGERALYGPNAWLFVVVPPAGNTLNNGAGLPSTLAASVLAYIAATGDPKVALLDASDRIPTRGLGNKGASQQAMIEGLHPQVQPSAAFGAGVAVKALGVINAPVAPFRGTFH